MHNIQIIVATDIEGGIAKDKTIPWIGTPESKVDLANFKSLTDGSPCIMGRKTYDELLAIMKVRKPGEEIVELLPNRQCFVVTGNAELEIVGATKVASIREARNHLPFDYVGKIFVIGGERLFIEALVWASVVHITTINHDYECDQFFPLNRIASKFVVDSREELAPGVAYTKLDRVKS